MYAEKYSWVVPWPGDWHLIFRALDVIFRKWAGIGIMKLASAAKCDDKKIEHGDFHKRHFVLMAVVEAMWGFCSKELEKNGKVSQNRSQLNHGSLVHVHRRNQRLTDHPLSSVERA